MFPFSIRGSASLRAVGADPVQILAETEAMLKVREAATVERFDDSLTFRCRWHLLFPRWHALAPIAGGILKVRGDELVFSVNTGASAYLLFAVAGLILAGTLFGHLPWPISLIVVLTGLADLAWTGPRFSRWLRRGLEKRLPLRMSR